MSVEREGLRGGGGDCVRTSRWRGETLRLGVTGGSLVASNTNRGVLEENMKLPLKSALRRSVSFSDPISKEPSEKRGGRQTGGRSRRPDMH